MRQYLFLYDVLLILAGALVDVVPVERKLPLPAPPLQPHSSNLCHPHDIITASRSRFTEIFVVLLLPFLNCMYQTKFLLLFFLFELKNGRL